MPQTFTPSGSEIIPKGPGAINSAEHAHNIYVGLIGEIIGVMAIAVIADMNEDLGKLMVTIMVGWLLLFLSVNGPWISSITKKV